MLPANKSNAFVFTVGGEPCHHHHDRIIARIIIITIIAVIPILMIIIVIGRWPESKMPRRRLVDQDSLKMKPEASEAIPVRSVNRTKTVQSSLSQRVERWSLKLLLFFHFLQLRDLLLRAS